MELNHQDTIPRIDPAKMARFYRLALVKSSKVELSPTTRGLGGTTFIPTEMRPSFAIWALKKDARRAAHLYYCVQCKQAFSGDDRSSSVTPLDPHGDPLHGSEAVKRLGTFSCSPVLALGGEQGFNVDMVAPLRAFARDVQGGAITFCGHLLPEEQPAAVARELIAFFSQGDDLTVAL